MDRQRRVQVCVGPVIVGDRQRLHHQEHGGRGDALRPIVDRVGERVAAAEIGGRRVDEARAVVGDRAVLRLGVIDDAQERARRIEVVGEQRAGRDRERGILVRDQADIVHRRGSLLHEGQGFGRGVEIGAAVGRAAVVLDLEGERSLLDRPHDPDEGLRRR